MVNFGNPAVIPAHPLLLTPGGQLDVQAQRRLTAYYLAAGVTGLAVGVHTTQFQAHDDGALLREVWELAAEESAANPDVLLIAGLCGDTATAVREAELAAELGYQVGLLCLRGATDRTEDGLIERARAVGEVMPTLGFDMQAAVGGIKLSYDYWRRLFDLPSVVGAKAAAFDRYRTRTLVNALLDSDRWREIALLTGNDDAIVADLATPQRRVVGDEVRQVCFAGGLLGQWAVGTSAAVELTTRVVAEREAGHVSAKTLAIGATLTDVNAALFDVGHNFAGCLAGVNELLRQQGLALSSRCLDDQERLSGGQAELIAKARRRHPYLTDEQFVLDFLTR